MSLISLEGSVRTCKVNTAWANRIQSDRFENPNLKTTSFNIFETSIPLIIAVGDFRTITDKWLIRLKI